MSSEELEGNFYFDQQTVAGLVGEDITRSLQEKNKVGNFIHLMTGTGTETHGADKITNSPRLITGQHLQGQSSANSSLPLSKNSKRSLSKREPNPDTPQADFHGPIVRKKSMEVREFGYRKPSVFKLEMQCHTSVDELCIPIYKVGKSAKSAIANEKNILLVGATGVGKKTLINGITNYLFGVKWEDDFRFATVTSGIVQKSQAYSPESSISVYKFACQPNFPVDYSVTIIYVPGIGGLDDFERDKRIVQQMQDFFQLETSSINHLHGIVLTIKATDTRVTPWQQYVYTSVKKLLVGGIEENMIVVATHSDGPQIRALRVLKETDVPYNEKLVFAVNNAALYCNNVPTDDDDEEDIMINKLQWKRNTKAYRDIFNALDKMAPQQLSRERMTAQDLSEEKEEPQQPSRKNVEPQQTALEKVEPQQTALEKAEPQKSDNKKVQPQQSFHKKGESHQSPQSGRKKIKSQRTSEMLAQDKMTSQEMSCDFVSPDRQGVLDSLKRQGQLAIFQVQLFKRKEGGGSRSKGSIIPLFIKLTDGRKAYYCRTCKWMCIGPSSAVRDPSHLQLASTSTCGACICVPNCKDSDHSFEEYETRFALVDADLPHGLPLTEMGGNCSDPMKGIHTKITSILRRANRILQNPQELLKFVNSIVDNCADMQDMEECVQSLRKCAKYISANPDISDKDLEQLLFAHSRTPAKDSGSKHQSQCPML